MDHRIQGIQDHPQRTTPWPRHPTRGPTSGIGSGRNLKAPLWSRSTLHNSQAWTETPCPSRDDCIRKRMYMYTMECCSPRRKKKRKHTEQKTNAIRSHAGGPTHCHTTWNTSEHEGQTPRDIPSIRNLTSETNEPFCIIETQGLENLFVIARLWGRLWEGLRFMSDRVKLLCFVCVSNEILFYGLHLVTYAENKSKTVWE